MMVLALLLGQTAPAAEPPPAEDIVVIGERAERLGRMRLVTRTDRRTGVRRCEFKRRSGDRRLDAAVCAAALDCAARVDTEAGIVPCLRPAMQALVAGTPWVAREARGDR